MNKEDKVDTLGIQAVALVILLGIGAITASVKSSIDHRASIHDTYHISAYIVDVNYAGAYTEGSSKNRRHYVPVQLKDEQGIKTWTNLEDSSPSIGSVVYKDCWTDDKGRWCDSQWSDSFQYENLTK